MRFVQQVSFDEVLRQFRYYHGSDLDYAENTNDDTEKTLHLLEEQLGGVWNKVFLNEKDIRKVILPWHLSCGGDFELVPKTGLTVEKVVNHLSKNETAFSKASPVCIQKMERLKGAELTPLFLTTVAAKRVFYQLLAPENKTGLIHIDGLHRMVAWVRSGRLKNGEEIETYIAGRL